MTSDTAMRVSRLLTRFPHLRDNDQRLCCMVWVRELEARDLSYNEMSAKTLMTMYATGEISNPDTITRIRRKLQEQNPNMRGMKYKQRQASQENVKKQLGY